MLGYYTLTFIENICIAVAWFQFRHGHSLMSEFAGATSADDEKTLISSQVALALMLTVVLSYVVGMALFAIYYLFLHPKAAVKVCQSADDVSHNNRRSLTEQATKRVTLTDGSHPEQLEKLQLSVVRPSSVEMTAIRRLYVPRSQNNKLKFEVKSIV